ncbi:hypothetical protein ACERII_19185 [Evansella sp. AB-rgal1]|uniref:hypothetical protein n=1 Tax=Evansella sp. AB-rgal1 TaxID=3242696 RepID=UPI00359E1EC3
MKIKHIWISIVSVYIVMSIPAIFGIGYVIDWVPDATLFQKIKGHVMTGFVENFLFKMVLACSVGITTSFLISRRQKIS